MEGRIRQREQAEGEVKVWRGSGKAVAYPLWGLGVVHSCMFCGEGHGFSDFSKDFVIQKKD